MRPRQSGCRRSRIRTRGQPRCTKTRSGDLGMHRLDQEVDRQVAWHAGTNTGVSSVTYQLRASAASQVALRRRPPACPGGYERRGGCCDPQWTSMVRLWSGRGCLPAYQASRDGGSCGENASEESPAGGAPAARPSPCAGELARCVRLYRCVARIPGAGETGDRGLAGTIRGDQASPA